MDVLCPQYIVDEYIALILFAYANLTSLNKEGVVIVTDVGNTMLGKLECVHQAPGFSLLAILRLASATFMCVCKRSL
jgi:hypothetical protein